MNKDFIINKLEEIKTNVSKYIIILGQKYTFTNFIEECISLTEDNFNVKLKDLINEINKTPQNLFIEPEQKDRFISLINQKINFIKANQVENIKPKNKKIFIVHGRDTKLKQSVYKILVGYGLEPIILEEQTNEGLTIIEKIEKNSDVGAAIVLLTPDDLGRLKTEKEDKHRARQNVIFELGYFIGKLGRNNVIYILDKKENIEIPTDISGLLHISVNDRLPENIKKELKQIRYDIV